MEKEVTLELDRKSTNAEKPFTNIKEAVKWLKEDGKIPYSADQCFFMNLVEQLKENEAKGAE